MRLISKWLFLLGFTQSYPGVRVLVLTRAGCHLCEDACAFLEAEAKRYGFELQALDVDTMPELGLAERYGHEVPVVQVGNRIRFRGKINRPLWERLIQAEIRKQRSPRAPAAPGEPAP